MTRSPENSTQALSPVWWQGIQNETRALVVAHLTFAEQHDDRASLTIADGVQFGVQSAFGPPDTTGNIPFLSKLAAVRCAFRCVASIMMRSNTPRRLQRMKRL